MSFIKIFEIAKGISVLFATILSLFFVLVAPIELMEVENSKTSEKIGAVFENAEYRTAQFRKSQKFLVLKFRTLSGEAVEIIDQRPGDIPFSIDFFGAIAYDSNKEFADSLQIGKEYRIIKSKNGKKYFFEPGNRKTMLALFLLSSMWIAGLIVISLRNKSQRLSKHAP